MNLAFVLVLWKYIIFFVVEKKHLIKALILWYNDKLFFHKMQSLLYGFFWRHRSNGILYINKLTYFVPNRKILQEKVYKEVIARFSNVFWIIYIDSWKSIALIQLYILFWITNVFTDFYIRYQNNLVLYVFFSNIPELKYIINFRHLVNYYKHSKRNTWKSNIIMKTQKQIENEFEKRMTFDQAIEWSNWIITQAEKI